MKIEIEIPDIEEIYSSYGDWDDPCSLNGKDLKRILIDRAITQFVDNMYDDETRDLASNSIRSMINELIKNNSNEIVDKVIDKVSQEILRKKAIVSEMPKKSEIANISKEWEDYFVELIDKAIAKRFR
jgi:hypothetical protein